MRLLRYGNELFDPNAVVRISILWEPAKTQVAADTAPISDYNKTTGRYGLRVFLAGCPEPVSVSYEDGPDAYKAICAGRNVQPKGDPVFTLPASPS